HLRNGRRARIYRARSDAAGRAETSGAYEVCHALGKGRRVVKSADRTKKLRDMSPEELGRQEAEMNEQMFKLRFQWAMGQTESLKKLRELRKDRARLLTILKERESA